MNIDKNSLSSSELTPAELSDALATNAENLHRIANEIYDLADRDRADPIALLQLLRTLEHLHREIQQDYFQSALPNSRQALYTLLRDIEENGGWPYIQRWKLQALFANLAETEK
jgi:ABC-type transporter Mla subunit MlaD